jgi:hypothetical protein
VTFAPILISFSRGWSATRLCRLGIAASVSTQFPSAGAVVDDAARPGIDDEAHHRLFTLLLRAATASRMRDEDFVRQQERLLRHSPRMI